MDRPKLQPRLVVIEGKDKGKAISLRNGTSIMGRSKGDVIIEDPRISRSHVAMHFDEKIGTLSFTDLKSLNGTLLNGQPAESGEIKDGDQLQLGNTLFDCQLRPDEWEASISISVRPPEPSAPPAGEVSISQVGSEPEPQRASARSTRVATNSAIGSGDDEESEFDEEELTKLAKFRQLYMKIPKRARLGIWTGALALFILWGLPSKEHGGLAGGDGSWSKVEALEKQGQPDEAFAMAEELQKANPEDQQLQMKAAEYFERQGRYDSAITSYTLAAHGKNPVPVATVKLISLLLRSGKTETAQEELGTLDGFLKNGPYSKELFTESAQLFIENKQLKHSPEKALILAKALQKEFAPGTAIGYKLEAQVLFQEKRNEEALAVIEAGLKLAPQDEWLLENLAFAKLSLKDLAGAEEVIRKWLESSPQNSKARLVMAYLRFNEKDYAGALPYTQFILEAKQNEPNDPYYKEALFLTGQIYWNREQPAEAAAFLKRACEVGYEPGCKHEALQTGDRSTATPAERSPGEPTAQPTTPENSPEVTQ
jgi:tetratricopeptide (TPR) repeat protein